MEVGRGDWRTIDCVFKYCEKHGLKYLYLIWSKRMKILFAREKDKYIVIMQAKSRQQKLVFEKRDELTKLLLAL